MWQKIPNEEAQNIRITTMHRDKFLMAPINKTIMQSND
jgi:hypothetical protein